MADLFSGLFFSLTLLALNFLRVILDASIQKPPKTDEIPGNQ